jgi:hypothetical protein
MPLFTKSATCFSEMPVSCCLPRATFYARRQSCCRHAICPLYAADAHFSSPSSSSFYARHVAPRRARLRATPPSFHIIDDIWLCCHILATFLLFFFISFHCFAASALASRLQHIATLEMPAACHELSLPRFHFQIENILSLSHLLHYIRY